MCIGILKVSGEEYVVVAEVSGDEGSTEQEDRGKEALALVRVAEL